VNAQIVSVIKPKPYRGIYQPYQNLFAVYYHHAADLDCSLSCSNLFRREGFGFVSSVLSALAHLTSKQLHQLILRQDAVRPLQSKARPGTAKGGGTKSRQKSMKQQEMGSICQSMRSLPASEHC